LITLSGGDVITGLPQSFRQVATGRIAGLPGSVIVMLSAAALAQVFFGNTRPGRHLFAFGSNARAAKIVGISRRSVWLTAFGLGGLAAALAGLLELAQNGSMQSGLGAGYELRAIAAAVIGGTAITGGRGSVSGVVLGAVLLSLIQNALVLWSVSRYHYDLVVGALLLATIMLDLVIRRNAEARLDSGPAP
jgi:ribose/xylose/arabinose/galactoside ABC-type transport system permease subunit